MPSLTVAGQARSALDPFQKLVFRTHDERLIESVRIPLERPGRFSVCVSSQVGCALACAFCATGRLGLSRNLETWEIVEQVRAVRRTLDPARGERVHGVVFQGMGEPLANAERVVAAIRVLTEPSAGAIDARNVTVCTAGLPSGIALLARELPRVRLGWSIGSAALGKRRSLMPIDGAHPLEDVFRAGVEHAKMTGLAPLWAVTLLAGVNDGDDDARALGLLAARFQRETGRRPRISVIPYNRIADDAADPVPAHERPRRSALSRNRPCPRHLHAQALQRRLGRRRRLRPTRRAPVRLRAGIHRRSATCRRLAPEAKLTVNGSRHRLELAPYAVELDAADGGRIVEFSRDGWNAIATASDSPLAYGTSFWPSPQSDWDWPPPPEIDRLPWQAKPGSSGDFARRAQRTRRSASRRRCASPSCPPARASASTTRSKIAARPRAGSLPGKTRGSARAASPSTRRGAPRFHRSTLEPSLVDGVAWLLHDPKTMTENRKSFADGAEGFLAHVENGHLFVAAWNDVPREQQAPGEAEVELYVDKTGRFVEIEAQGPFEELAPGASLVWTVFFSLERLAPSPRA